MRFLGNEREEVVDCLESTPAARSFTQHPTQRSQNKSQQLLFDSTSATGIRLTCLLLIISFIFVVCTLPISIRSILADLLPEVRSTSHWQLTQLSLTLLMYFNHTVTRLSLSLFSFSGRILLAGQLRSLLFNWTSLSP